MTNSEYFWKNIVKEFWEIIDGTHYKNHDTKVEIANHERPLPVT